MYFKVKRDKFPTWKKIKTTSPYDAIYILFDVHSLFFKSTNDYNVYINPKNQEHFSVKKVED